MLNRTELQVQNRTMFKKNILLKPKLQPVPGTCGAIQKCCVVVTAVSVTWHRLASREKNLPFKCC